MWSAACAGSQTGNVVRPGIDVLVTDSIHLVQNVRVGLLTNQTGVDRAGIPDVTRLLDAGIELTALYSPEHGYRGILDQENIDHSIDSATGLPIYSLYGEVRAPTDLMGGVDVLLIDLQDIGSRTYTYVSTAILAMQAAKAAGVDVLLLDRPNPIGGMLVQGPPLDPAFSSFVGMLPVPLRHGMTMGELVLFANSILEIEAEITVIPAAGWERSMWFPETGLPWIRPSPNMPSLESATHYPGLVLFEATNLSVGRGTPIAFQFVGAPWLDPRQVIDNLSEHPGVLISDTTITPVDPPDGKFDRVALPAVRFLVEDRETYDPVRLAADLFGVLRATHGDSITIRSETMDRLAGSDGFRLGTWTTGALGSWGEGLEAFRHRRAGFLLY